MIGITTATRITFILIITMKIIIVAMIIMKTIIVIRIQNDDNDSNYTFEAL